MRIIGNNPAAENAEITAIASGTLPSGQPVVVNADGTVSVVAETSVTQAIGTEATLEDSNNDYIVGAFDTTNNKVVFAYRDQGNSNYGAVVCGDISGTSITFGTPVTFNSGSSYYMSIAFSPDRDSFVIAYTDGSAGNDGYAHPVYVSDAAANALTTGTRVEFSANSDSQYNQIVYDGADGSGGSYFLIHWRDDTNSQSKAALINYPSGSHTLSLENNTTVIASNVIMQDIAASSAAGSGVVSYRFTGDYIYAKTYSRSGTTVSFGSQQTIYNTKATADARVSYNAASDKYVFVWNSDASPQDGNAVVASVSGTTITTGTVVQFNSTSTAKPVPFYHSASGNTVVSYKDNASSDYGKLVVATISGTDISFGSEIAFIDATVGGQGIEGALDTENDQMVFGYARPSGGKGYAKVFRPAYTSTNLTAENFIGFSGGVIKTFSQSEAIGTESTFETGNVYSAASGYHVAEKKTLLMFRDASDSNKIKGRLVTATGTALSYGSIVEVTGQVGGFESGAVVYDSVNEKLVVIFRGNTNYSYAVVATISGSSLTFGTPVVFNSAASYVTDGVYDSTSGKIVVTYEAASVSYLKVGTVSGTSISFGSATSLGSGSSMTYGTLAYDPVNDKTIYGQQNSNNSDGIAYVCTVSGTSISVGSPTTFNTNLAQIYGSFYDAPSGKIGFIVGTGGGPGEGYVGTVSGTSISFGSGVQFQSGISQGKTGYDSRVNKFTVACRSINSPYPGLLRVGTISGNTFSFASPVTFNSGETAPLSVGFDSDQGTSIIAFTDGGDGDLAKAIGFQVAGSYVVSSSVASGDRAVINSTCTVDSNQSSLTAGQQYFVQTDGTIGLTAADPSVIAGTAISATEIIVKG